MTKISGHLKTSLPSAVIMGVIAIALLMGVTSQSYNGTQNNATYPGNLVLNIYIDEGGKALTTGYADSIEGLPFLKGSQYKYDKDTKQLYALTNSLTYKTGDDWETKLPTQGNYSEYHSIFYLPATVRISKIESTPGLDYLVSAANDSFQVDFHGYDVKSPTITIDYQLPITESSMPSVSNARSLTPFVAALGLVLASGALVIWIRRRGALQSSHGDHKHEGSKDLTSESQYQSSELLNGSGEVVDSDQTSGENKQSESDDYFVVADDLPVEIELQPSGLESPVELKDNFIEPGEESFKVEDSQHDDDKEAPKRDESVPVGIEITSEMAAIMETMTAREKAVLDALIDHNGKMNQADIRYETGIPKSSLTGILLSLERRKLVTKKEKGRTNAIELSEWFLSKKDHPESNK